LKNAQGQTVGAIEVLQDITQQKNAEHGFAESTARSGETGGKAYQSTG